MFKTLKSWAFVVEVIGWIIGALSTIFFLTALVAFLQSSSGSFGGGLALASLLPSLAGMIAGIYFVVTGQAIRCFVAIEANTRETNRLLQSAQTSKRPETVKQAVAGSVLGLTSHEREVEAEVKRVAADMERQKAASLSCPKCGKAYPVGSRGQFCEECGSRL